MFERNERLGTFLVVVRLCDEMTDNKEEDQGDHLLRELPLELRKKLDLSGGHTERDCHAERYGGFKHSSIARTDLGIVG